MKLRYNISLTTLLLLSLFSNTNKAQTVNGADLLFSENQNLIAGKNIGVICNHTSLLNDGTHLVDALIEQKDVTVKAIFTPEHGLNGIAEAGEHIDYKKNLYKEVPIISLYGKEKKPSKENLKDIDLLIYDIQDVGARFYTYISTMYYTLEAAGENNIPVIILDRPNPIGGSYIDGPVLDPNYKSFVGIAELPITYGMSVGELAKYFIGEKITPDWKNISLTVIACKNWKREIPNQFYSKWNSPSPNINSLETALVYPGTCLIEGTNISEGRGTIYPFLQIGAPFFNADAIIEKLNLLKVEGAEFQAVEFVPEDIEEMATNPKFEGETCYGIKIKVTDPNKFESVKLGVNLLYVLTKLYGDKINFNGQSFDRLAGSSILREQLKNRMSPDKIFATWQKDLTKFNKKINQYLLY
ncbi:MAG TPA: DUF1343 domain-containing protein [Ignavibacteriaceae bacterium]